MVNLVGGHRGQLGSFGSPTGVQGRGTFSHHTNTLYVQNLSRSGPNFGIFFYIFSEIQAVSKIKMIFDEIDFLFQYKN